MVFLSHGGYNELACSKPILGRADVATDATDSYCRINGCLPDLPRHVPQRLTLLLLGLGDPQGIGKSDSSLIRMG